MTLHSRAAVKRWQTSPSGSRQTSSAGPRPAPDRSPSPRWSGRSPSRGSTAGARWPHGTTWTSCSFSQACPYASLPALTEYHTFEERIKNKIRETERKKTTKERKCIKKISKWTLTCCVLGVCARGTWEGSLVWCDWQTFDFIMELWSSWVTVSDWAVPFSITFYSCVLRRLLLKLVSYK